MAIPCIPSTTHWITALASSAERRGPQSWNALANVSRPDWVVERAARASNACLARGPQPSREVANVLVAASANALGLIPVPTNANGAEPIYLIIIIII